MVYVYALSEPLSDPPGGCGLDGEPLRVISTGQLAAVVSDCAAAALRVSEDVLWAHERVVEQLMLERAVLPMRFGSTVIDDDAVRRMLVTRQQELTDALRCVSGAVEFGVRATCKAQATTDEQPTAAAARGAGAMYLLRRSASYRRARALAERLDRSLAELSRARVQRPLSAPGLPVRAAYLVDHADVDAFRGCIATLNAEVEDAQIVCTGPWPPYSFTVMDAS